jgi:hypothetical protein
MRWRRCQALPPRDCERWSRHQVAWASPRRAMVAVIVFQTRCGSALSRHEQPAEGKPQIPIGAAKRRYWRHSYPTPIALRGGDPSEPRVARRRPIIVPAGLIVRLPRRYARGKAGLSVPETSDGRCGRSHNCIDTKKAAKRLAGLRKRRRRAPISLSVEGYHGPLSYGPGWRRLWRSDATSAPRSPSRAT